MLATETPERTPIQHNNFHKKFSLCLDLLRQKASKHYLKTLQMKENHRAADQQSCKKATINYTNIFLCRKTYS